MTDPVLFPDICEIIATEIRAQLTAWGVLPTTVGTIIPNPRPSRLVLIRRVGGPRGNLVADNPTVTIEAWAPDEGAAHDLLQLARALVFNMRGSVHDDHAIYRVGEFAGPASLPDPVSDSPRWTCTLSVSVRGSALTLSS